MSRRLLLTLLAVSVLGGPAVARAAPAAAVAAPAAAPVSAADFERAAARMLALMEAVAAAPGAPPALSLVLVRRGQPPVIWTHGRLAAEGETPVDADTPFYIASQTKAFVGLMAAKLDARGVFDLDQTLADIWPDLALPEGADARAITFRHLLSHQAPIENPVLSFRTAYSDRVPADDYGRLLAEASTVRPPGFRYSNLGYLIYSAALEVETGRDWRDWIEAELFAPAGMSRTGTGPSRLPAGVLPRYHRWMADAGWDSLAGKPDDLMHAAGGLNASPNDMARWLRLQLGEANAAVDPALVRASQLSQVEAPMGGGAFECQGYALGWNICRIGAVDVLAHGGGYTGVRSSMAVSPELGIGLAFMSNSDSLTGALSQEAVSLFFAAAQDPGFAFPEPGSFAADYAVRVRAFAEGRLARVAERRAEPRWAGWDWRPSAAEAAAYAGRYRHPSMGEFVVAADGAGLRARLGVLDLPLEPAAPDLFGFSDGPADPPAAIHFERRGGGVAALIWDDDRFEKIG